MIGLERDTSMSFRFFCFLLCYKSIAQKLTHASDDHVHHVKTFCHFQYMCSCLNVAHSSKYYGFSQVHRGTYSRKSKKFYL